MKRNFIFVFILILSLSSIIVYANDEKKESNIEKIIQEQMSKLGIENPVEGKDYNIVIDDGSKRPTACPYGNGICDAVSHGWGLLYVDDNYVFSGCIWQCSNCHTVYITEYDPLWDGTIGRWASMSYSEPLSGTTTFVFSNGYSSTSSSTIPGINFSYQ